MESKTNARALAALINQARRPDQRITRQALAMFSRLVFRFYGRWQVIGLENVPATGGVLLAANHASYVDPPLAWAALYPRRKMWGVGKAELWHSPVLAYLMDSIGAIPVQRGVGDRTLFKRVLELLAQGEAVGLFPEGTRSPDGQLLPGQPGVGLMVQKSGVPVVPTAIVGTHLMLPVHATRLRRAPLTVVFGPPLTFAPGLSREEITAQIMRALAEMLTQYGCPQITQKETEDVCR